MALRDTHRIDLGREQPVSFNTARRFPELAGESGRGPDVATLWRWATGRGCRGHRLASVLVGGRRYTTREAVIAFLSAVNGESVDASTAVQCDAAEAEAQLARMGFTV